MALVVEIVSGSRTGARETFGKAVVIAGRHPTSDLLFDANKDLDVSTRHAEFRSSARGWSVHDLGSTNGTFVNGRRISAPTNLANGDTVSFGESGPRVKIVSMSGVSDVAPPRTEQRASAGVTRPKTEERIAMAVAQQTSGLKRFVIGLGVVVVIGVGALVWMNQSQASQANEAIARLLARGDSLAAALQQSLTDANVRAAGFDSVERILREERMRLAKAIQAGGNVTQLTSELDAVTRRGNQALALTSRQVNDVNGKAIAYVVVMRQDSTSNSGTAFGVAESGLLVTNRHVLLDDFGQPPKKIAVVFADVPRAVLEARYVGVADSGDIGFIQLVLPGPYPVVRGIATSDGLSGGDPIMMIGFPNGLDLNAERGIIRGTITAGIVSRVESDRVKMNIFAAQGSSGSPVFDSRGYVIGVLFGGEGGASSTMTYAALGRHLIAALPAEAKKIVRQ